MSEKRDLTGLSKQAAEQLRLHTSVLEWSGQSQVKNTRVLGITFVRDFFPGLTKMPKGIVLMRIIGKRGWALQLSPKRCFAMFKAGGARRWRKGQNVLDIFQTWALERAQTVDQDKWIDVMHSDPLEILTKEQADAILNAKTYDAASDKELYR